MNGVKSQRFIHVVELKGQVQRPGSLTVEKKMMAAIEELVKQSQASNKKILNFLSQPLPVAVSVKSDVEKILARLEDKIEKSTMESKKAIKDHGARIAKLESVYRKHYKRKVKLGERHLGKKVKHFFVGIKE